MIIRTLDLELDPDPHQISADPNPWFFDVTEGTYLWNTCTLFTRQLAKELMIHNNRKVYPKIVVAQWCPGELLFASLLSVFFPIVIPYSTYRI